MHTKTASTTSSACCRAILFFSARPSTSSALVMLAASASAAGCDGLLAGMGYEKCDHGLARHASGLRLQDANRGDFVQEQATRLDQIHRRPISSGDALGAANAACADALAEVNAMVALGVRVIVLGVGTGLADDPSGDDTCLDALAHAGGVAASPGYPGFFTLSDSQQLHMVIEELFGGIVRPPCSVRLSNKVAIPLNMAVYMAAVFGTANQRGSHGSGSPPRPDAHG